MAENKEYITRQESMGTIQISEDVVASISSSVALETEGVGGLLNANMADLVGGKPSLRWLRRSRTPSIRRWRA